VGRFYFEFLRGDSERPYYFGFSEAQWTSLAIVCVAIAVEMRGFLPFHLWHVAAAACLLLTVISIGAARWWISHAGDPLIGADASRR
jgi:hypothetical protein